jgi:lipopolysaccharide transport protein LptA
MHPLIKRLLILVILVIGAQEVYKMSPLVNMTDKVEGNLSKTQLNAFATQLTNYQYNKEGKLEEVITSSNANFFTDKSAKITDIQLKQYDPQLETEIASMSANKATITADNTATLTDKVIYQNKNKPAFRVYADKMVASDNKQQITYQGNVKIYHLDNTMLADTLVADMANDADKIFTAHGKKVSMVNTVDKINASAEKIVYYPDRKYIELSGDAEFISPQQQVRGDYVKYYLQSGKLEVKNQQGEKRKPMITIDNL